MPEQEAGDSSVGGSAGESPKQEAKQESAKVQDLRRGSEAVAMDQEGGDRLGVFNPPKLVRIGDLCHMVCTVFLRMTPGTPADQNQDHLDQWLPGHGGQASGQGDRGGYHSVPGEQAGS